MRKIEATGFESELPEDRPVLYVSSGAGNHAGVPEVHIHFHDPVDGSLIAWFPRDALVAALLDPDEEPRLLAKWDGERA
jgi:hypothetical protein